MSCSTNLITILLGDERPWGGGCVSREESERSITGNMKVFLPQMSIVTQNWRY
jgi:hypothetical protein